MEQAMALMIAGFVLLALISLARLFKRGRKEANSWHGDETTGSGFDDQHIQDLIEIMSRQSGALPVQHSHFQQTA